MCSQRGLDVLFYYIDFRKIFLKTIPLKLDLHSIFMWYFIVFSPRFRYKVLWCRGRIKGIDLFAIKFFDAVGILKAQICLSFGFVSYKVFWCHGCIKGTNFLYIICHKDFWYRGRIKGMDLFAIKSFDVVGH